MNRFAVLAFCVALALFWLPKPATAVHSYYLPVEGRILDMKRTLSLAGSFVQSAPATLFSLSMWQRLSRVQYPGSEFWAEKLATGNSPYQCLKAVFDKEGNVLYVACYTAVDAKKKETLEVFYKDIAQDFAAPPAKGRYTFKSKGGSEMSVEIGNMFLRPHADMRLEATIDGVTLPLILELKPDPNHFGHDLAREGAPFAKLKSSYRVQVTQGLWAIALHKLDWSPGSNPAKNRAVAMGVDAQGKPLYVSSYAQTKNGDSYEMFLAQ